MPEYTKYEVVRIIPYIEVTKKFDVVVEERDSCLLVDLTQHCIVCLLTFLHFPSREAFAIAHRLTHRQLWWRGLWWRSVACLFALILALRLPMQPAQAAQSGMKMAMSGAAQVTQTDVAGAAEVPHAPGRLLLGLEPGVTRQQIEAELLPAGWVIEEIWPSLNLAAIRIQTGEVGAASDVAGATVTAQSNLAASPLLRYATLDVQVQTAQTPDDPNFDMQWSFQSTRAHQAWQITQGHNDMAIAVIDTGMDHEHEDLQDATLWKNAAEANGIAGYDDDANGHVDDIHGWDWIDGDNLPDDANGHGTHVAGILAAVADNGVGIAGHGGNIAIAPLRVLDSRGTGYVTDLVRSIDYAVEQGFRIINLSLTISVDSPALHDAIRAASDSGALVLAAAGNSAGATAWPAAYEEVVGVAATNSHGQRATYSNHGPGVELAAPGSNIYSTYLLNGYREQSGTSMATPHVAALAGLLWTLRPDLDADGIVGIMQATARDLNALTYPGFDEYLGAGEIDFQAALDAASAAIAIEAVNAVPDVVLTGADVQLDVKLSTAAAQTANAADPAAVQSVRGANVTQRVLDANGHTISTVTAASGVDGTATLTSRMPITPGAYTLSATVGSAGLQLPLAVRATPVRLMLDFASNQAVAGGRPLPFHVQVDDPEEITTEVTVPLHLSTDLGWIRTGKGQEVSSTTVQINSQTGYTGTLIPGTVAATGKLTARIGLSETVQPFTIHPSPAAQLILPKLDTASLNVASDPIKLSFEVLDAYGNTVPDGTAVEVTASTGSLDPATPQTDGGRAVTTLTLNEPTYNFTIEARVPATGITAKERFVLMHRTLFPQMHVTPSSVD